MRWHPATVASAVPHVLWVQQRRPPAHIDPMGCPSAHRAAAGSQPGDEGLGLECQLVSFGTKSVFSGCRISDL